MPAGAGAHHVKTVAGEFGGFGAQAKIAGTHHLAGIGALGDAQQAGREIGAGDQAAAAGEFAGHQPGASAEIQQALAGEAHLHLLQSGEKLGRKTLTVTAVILGRPAVIDQRIVRLHQ